MLTEIGFSMGVAKQSPMLTNVLIWKPAICFSIPATQWAACSVRYALRCASPGCSESPSGDPPRLGEHNREILCGIGGLTPSELEALEAQGAV